ncbi:MAG: response regulator [Mariprofundaceae bacterium]
MKILIVDDQAEDLYLLESMLGGGGYETVSAADGAQAMEKLRIEPCDMIISDILMPVMNGFELCRKIKSDARLRRIPFVCYTATYTDEDDEQLAMNMGADKFIRKPVAPDQFLRMIKSLGRDVNEGQLRGREPPLEGEKTVSRLYSERLVKKLKEKTLELKREIAEREHVEEMLRLSQFTLDHSSDAAFWADQDAHFVNVNETACSRYGYTRDEFLTMSVFDIDADFPCDAWPDHWRELKKRSSFHLESVHKTKAGESFPVDISVNHVCYHGREYNFAFVTDISGRRQAETSMRKLSQAIEQAGESILITDRGGVIEYVNPAFTKLTGFTAKEAIGNTPRILKSGNQDAVFYEAMWQTITSGEIWHGKVTDKRKDGSFYPTTLTISPIMDEGGKCSHFVGIQADLSDLEEMEHRFHQAQKMEAIGTLVGGIAHDFNNILSGMTGNLYLAKEKVKAQPDVVRKLANVEKLSFRAADMIQQLLTFARKGSVSMKQLPFTIFVKETLKFLRASVPENIALHLDICTASLSINGDVTQLHQVLMNLINNARDAVEGADEPCIAIRLELFQPTEDFLHRRAYFNVDRYAHLSVEDNGYGIPEDMIEHVFEPFFTTKEIGKGTGLGLAMVYGAIKTHHGFVEVESIAGQGSTFHIYLPLLVLEAIAAVPANKEEIVQGNGEAILLADDEPHVREALADVLTALGYKVLTAKDGLEALEIFKAHQGEIALAMLDVVMPNCSGTLLARRIRKVNPDVPVIFMTGYDKEHVLSSGEQIQNSDAITKPFHFDVLSRSIRKLLDFEHDSD